MKGVSTQSTALTMPRTTGKRKASGKLDNAKRLVTINITIRMGAPIRRASIIITLLPTGYLTGAA